MQSSRRVTAGILALALVAPVAHAGDNRGQPAGPAAPAAARETLSVRTHRGAATFHLSAPDQARSPALRDNRDRADKNANVPPPAAGWTLSNRVIVRASDAAAMRARSAAAANVRVEPLAGVPGFWLFTAPSVRAAIELADALAGELGVREAYVDIESPRVLRTLPNDPLFPQEWHLVNAQVPLFDVNCEPAWDLGFTGLGVIIGIVEGGWQYDHPDLAANFAFDATQAGGSATSHGTAVAGVAAARGNNALGVAGIAYEAQVSGLIFGTAAQNADAFAFRNDIIHIKSNSWGPPDVGEIATMSSAERTAIESALRDGRAGLGVIFCWAAGNGGTADRVDYDPYASSRYTIAIGAIGDQDTKAPYNEVGSSMTVVTQSDGNTRRIYSTDLVGSAGYSTGDYTSTFGGTSAACPLGAGAVALMLQANPELTWRDVQHILIDTARKCDPTNAQWMTNGAGRDFSQHYGFGAIDAGAAVAAAQTWQNVDPELVVNTTPIPVNQVIPDNDATGVTKVVTIPAIENIRVESVELILNVDTNFIGDLQITFTSPAGTASQVAKKRSDPQNDYIDYIFTSLRHWDEESVGPWSVNIADRAALDVATWIDYRFKVYGTSLGLPLCPGDATGDDLVDNADLQFLIDAWGTSADDLFYRLAADFNRDGRVDNADLQIMLENWGLDCTPPCPGDVNDDRLVDNIDLQAVLDAWAAADPDPRYNSAADFNSDGQVENADLQVILDNWAASCP
jgi:subtilisin-like proprotein convertase family protein